MRENVKRYKKAERQTMGIRKNPAVYMQELKEWLAETKEEELEAMDSFFEVRLPGYETHMQVWEKDYQRMADFVLEEAGRRTLRTPVQLLDLGCGTGLELEEIWKREAALQVTGIDLCKAMLDKLSQKGKGRNLELICADYFQQDFGSGRWEIIISFESLHHFLPEKKSGLYQKIYKALKKDGVFICGDYFACCEEEEALLREVYLEKRKRSSIPETEFVHFDIPLTLEHEAELLEGAGFQEIYMEERDTAAFLLAYKRS